MEWLKARRKLVIGILMVVTLMVAYSSKTREPIQTFLFLAVITGVVILLEVLVLRLLHKSRS